MRTHTIKLNRTLLTLSAAGVLLASPAFAQNQGQTNQSQTTSQANSSQQQQATEFQSMDQDRDNLLVWREIHVVMDPRIVAAGLDQEQIFEEYDENQDDALDAQEFEQFIGGLQDAEGTAGQTAMSGSDQQGANGSGQRAATTGSAPTAMNRDLTPTMGGQPGSATPTQAQASASTRATGSAQAGTSTQNADRAGSTNTTIEPTDESVSADQTEYDTQSDTRVSDAEPISTFEEPNDTSLSGTAADTDTGTSLGSASDARSAPESNAMSADSTTATGAAAGGAMAGASGNAANNSQTGSIGSSQADVNAASEPTGQPQPTASVDTGSEVQSIYQVPIDSLKDKSVVNSAGDKIGSVDQVVVNSESGEAGLVVSSGGVMGIGGSKLLAPISEVTISGDNITWQTSKNKKELKESEKYDSQNYNQVSDNYETLGEIGSEGISAR